MRFISAFKILLLGIVVIIALASCRDESDKKIKIGAVYSQTGNIAPYGQKAIQGLKLALDEANSEETLFELVLEDAKSTPKDAVSAFNKLMLSDVSIVIGPESSGLAMAVAPIAKKKEVVLFAPTVASKDFPSSSKWAFRNWPRAELLTKKMADYLNDDQSISRVALMYINNDMGNSYANSFKPQYTGLGGEIAIEESYNPDETSFKSALLRIKEANVDALYLIGQIEMGQVIKQMHEIGMGELPVYSGIGIEDPKVIEIAGSLANGIIYTAPYFERETKKGQEYAEAFSNKYGAESDIFAASTYDATRIIIDILKKGKTSPEEIREALLKVENYPGITGLITIEENGDVNKSIAVKEVVNGEFVTKAAKMEPQPVGAQ